MSNIEETTFFNILVKSASVLIGLELYYILIYSPHNEYTVAPTFVFSEQLLIAAVTCKCISLSFRWLAKQSNFKGSFRIFSRSLL
jgi:hypothetical protein